MTCLAELLRAAYLHLEAALCTIKVTKSVEIDGAEVGFRGSCGGIALTRFETVKY